LGFRGAAAGSVKEVCVGTHLFSFYDYFFFIAEEVRTLAPEDESDGVEYEPSDSHSISHSLFFLTSSTYLPTSYLRLT
jgi:hypothetical protein